MSKMGIAKAINQNDIIKVIKSTTKKTNAFADCLEAVKSVILVAASVNMNTVKQAAMFLNDFENIMISISNAAGCVTDKNLHKLSRRRIKRVAKTISLFNGMLAYVAELLKQTTILDDAAMKNYGEQIIALGKILDVLIKISKIELPNPIVFKMKFIVIRYMIWYINKQITETIKYLESRLGPKNLKVVDSAIKIINASNAYVDGMVKSLEAILAIKMKDLMFFRFKFNMIKSAVECIYNGIQQVIAVAQQQSGKLAAIEYETKVFKGIYDFLIAISNVIDAFKFASIWLVLTVKLRIAAVAYIVYCVTTGVSVIAGFLTMMQPMSLLITQAMYFWDKALNQTALMLQTVKNLLSFKTLIWFFVLGNLRLKMFRKALTMVARVIRSIIQLKVVILAVGSISTAAIISGAAGMFYALRQLFITIMECEPPGPPLLKWMFFNSRIKSIKKALFKIGELLATIMILKPIIIASSPLLTTMLIFQCTLIFIATRYMLRAIKKAAPGLFFSFFAKRLIKALRIARKVIRSVMRLVNQTFRLSIARIKKARKRIGRAIKFVISFILLIQALIILALALAMFIIASPIIVLGLLALLIVSGALVLALKALVFIFKFIRLKDLAVIGLIILALILIVGMFLLLAVMLMLIAKINEQIVWLDVFEFLLMVLALLVIFVAVGALLSYVATYLLPIVAAIVITIMAMVVIVGAILLLATFLWLLTKIELDKDAIMDSVKSVMDTAIGVIAAVFEGLAGDETDEEGKPKGWFETVIGFVGGVATTLIKAILSVYVLALSLVAIGIILFIALELRLLQELALDRNAIKTNVQIVIDTALMVVDMIFGGGEEKEDEGAGKPWYKAVFEWVGGAIFKLISAILSVYFLAYSMIAIALVLFIATELRILMEINLNKEVIRDRVSTVIDTAIMVQELIFGGGGEQEDDNANKPWYKCVFEWIGGTVMKLISALLSVYFLAMSVVAIGLVLFIAAELKTLQDMGLQHEVIKESVTACIDTAIFVSNIFDRRDEKADDPSTKGFIPSLIEFFTPGPMVAIMDAIMAVGFLAISLVAISMVLGIAASLKAIENLNLNASAVTSSVTTCIDTAFFVINKVFSKDTHKEEKSGGVIESLLEFTMGKGMTNIIKALVAVGFLACAQAAIGMVGKIAKDLNELHKLPNLNGVQNKVSAVVRSGQAVINTIFAGGAEATEDALKAEKYLHSISRMMPLLRKLAPQMVQLANYTSKLGRSNNTQQIKETLSLYLWYIKELKSISRGRNFLNAAKGINGIVGSSAKLSYAASKVDPNTLQSVLTSHVNFLNDVSNLRLSYDLSENIKTVIQEVYKLTTAKFDERKIGETLKNYSDFLKVVDSVDIENLKTAARMVEKMADFSQSINGNFEQLAETLNEKIAPLLEELKEAMDKVSTKVEESGASISTSVHESGRSDLTEDELKNQVKRENPKATAEEISKLVVKRLKDQAESNPNKNDLSMIIKLLKTGVKTI